MLTFQRVFYLYEQIVHKYSYENRSVTEIKRKV